MPASRARSPVRVARPAAPATRPGRVGAAARDLVRLALRRVVGTADRDRPLRRLSRRARGDGAQQGGGRGGKRSAPWPAAAGRCRRAAPAAGCRWRLRGSGAPARASRWADRAGPHNAPPPPWPGPVPWSDASPIGGQASTLGLRFLTNACRRRAGGGLSGCGRTPMKPQCTGTTSCCPAHTHCTSPSVRAGRVGDTSRTPATTSRLGWMSPEKAGKGPRKPALTPVPRPSLSSGQPRFAGFRGWRDPDSNRGHHDFQSGTLTRPERPESLEIMHFRARRRERHDVRNLRSLTGDSGVDGHLRPKTAARLDWVRRAAPARFAQTLANEERPAWHRSPARQT